jgi:fibronectin type 3 domain-containing protein
MAVKLRATVISLFLAASVIVPAQQPVPTEFQDLYAELQTALTDFRQTINGSWDGTKSPVAFSANLLSVNSSRGPALLAPGYRDSVAYELDGLKALGVTAVSLDVSFPVFYRPFHTSLEEYEQYLDFYKGVAADVRARGLKLIVETQALFTQGGYTYWDLGPFYAGLTLEQYQQGRMEVVRTIALNLRPDYLSVIQEPDTEAEQTGRTEVGTAAGSAALLDVILNGLQAAGVQGVAVGAGLGTWQLDYRSFVENFAARPIDFLDMHVYPVNRDYLERALEIADVAASYGKQVAMSETWLYKVSARDLDVIDFRTIFARDVFSFWAPLDTLHLQAMVDLAHFKRFAFVSPFWSAYFRGYATYDDTTKDLPPAALNILAVREQLANTRSGTYTASGLAYKNAILDPPDVTPPSAPPNLNVQLLTVNSVVLTWSPAADNVGTAGYSVFRDGIPQGRTGLTSVSDSGLADGREYVYTVTALDASSNSSPPAAVTITTRDVTPPSVPTGLTGVATRTGSQIDINLSWTPSTDNVGVATYRVYRGTSPANLILVGVPATPSFTIFNVAPDTTYYFAVSARDAVRNDSGQSDAVAVTTSATPDVTPPVVEVTSPTEGSKVSGSTYVYARVYDPPGGPYDVPSGPAGVQFKVDGTNIGSEETVPQSTTGQYSVYRVTWEIKGLKKGHYVITAVARDRAGNVATSAGVGVTVKND